MDRLSAATKAFEEAEKRLADGDTSDISMAEYERISVRIFRSLFIFM